MRKFLLIIALSIPLLVFAQDTIQLKWDKGAIDFTDITAIKKGISYKVELRGINSAHHRLILEAKSFELYTPLPDVLKAIAPGLTGSSVIFYKGHLNIGSVKNIIDSLNTIKQKADSLHKLSKNQPEISSSTSILTSLLSYFNCQTTDLLLGKVSNDISLINTSCEMIKGILPNLTNYNPYQASTFSSILHTGEELKKNDFLKYLKYIINSCKAVDTISTKSFKTAKDLTDLHLILIDTYTNDTLYNEVKTLYNYGGLGLSFSTGFFYTEGLGDQPYYLESRTDGNVAVMKDQRTVQDFSIGGMGHIYYKVTSCFKIGPSLGLSISPFDGKSRYLLGLSALFGEEKMVGINLGKAWAKVNNLSALVKQDATGFYLPAGTTTVPQYQSIKSTWFIGFTYNLVATKK